MLGGNFVLSRGVCLDKGMPVLNKCLIRYLADIDCAAGEWTVINLALLESLTLNCSLSTSSWLIGQSVYTPRSHTAPLADELNSTSSDRPPNRG